MMTIRYTNGCANDETEDYDDAVELLTRRYPEAVFTRLDGWDGEPDEEISVLVWRDKDDAGPRGCGDDGSNAVAEIFLRPERVGTVWTS